MQKCLKPTFFLMASRGRLQWLQKVQDGDSQNAKLQNDTQQSQING